MAQLDHKRTRSIPQIRLEQPLPALPLLPPSISPITPQISIEIPDPVPYEPYRDETGDDGLPEEEMVGLRIGRLARRPISHLTLSPLSPSPQTPYLDSPSQRSLFRDSPASNPSISVSPAETLAEQSKPEPPEYEPMYDYLRSRPTVHAFTSPNSNTFLSPTSAPQSPVDYTPYRDSAEHPFIITLSPLSPTSGREQQPPPSYEELYLQHPCPHRQGELAALVRQMDSEYSVSEEICKFMLGMCMLALCIVGVGLAFNWGRGWGPPGGGY